jgi:hypothetical protein
MVSISSLQRFSDKVLSWVPERTRERENENERERERERER